MRSFLNIFLLLGACLLPQMAGAQVKASAVIRAHEESFTLQSPATGTHHVKTTVLVQDKAGLSQAAVHIYTDTFTSLGAFSGEIVTASGSHTKLSRKDLVSFAYSSGLVDDGFLSVYLPSEALQVPFTVTYDYTVQYKKGVISFPVFAPVTDTGVRLEEASFTVDVPEGTELIGYTAHVEAAAPRTEKKRTVYRWTAADFTPLAEEDMSPPLRERIPLVYSAPVRFSYAGTQGSQADWKEYGKWLYTLQEGADVLPDDMKARVQEMTKDCATPLEKLKVLYGFLRTQTRYVSIQLGIGGLKPAPAADVARTGYGDCKALSNYLMALLAAAGVPSEYYIISTDRKDLLPGFTTVGQMNHAMLAVPLAGSRDTVFVECTNPSYPLGYRHSGAAGHEAVLIGPDGGKPIRIGAYPDSLSRRLQETQVTLSESGNAVVSVRRTLFQQYIESCLDFKDRKTDEQNRILTSGMKFTPERLQVESVTDNFDSYAGEGLAFCPEMTFTYRFAATGYASKGNGERMFVPLNPVNKGLSYQKAARQEDLFAAEGFTTEDRISVRIPPGFSVENLPGSVQIDSEWGSFSSEAVLDGRDVRIVQRLSMKPFRCDKSRYEAYRDFARKVDKAYDAQFILVRATAASGQ